MAGPSQVIRIDALRSVAFGSITSSYTALGAEFAHPVRMLRFVNTTNENVLISFDTINDNLILTAGSFILYDGNTNRVQNLQYFIFTAGSQAFIKYESGAPTSGAVYLECLYGQGE